ncbi:hypothetical protein POM88_040951 [Heracleum sosnowskyi]|uniref:Uncharacterized protein n=1 Tax=Heracleum sosnowskyi TaxID=360622 RepID=A0AAD8HD85_9APIA|nr:hypothetical protein POM88_040951 [Heracleum sosnowskyi]
MSSLCLPEEQLTEGFAKPLLSIPSLVLAAMAVLKTVSSTSSKLEILHDGKMEETIDDDDDENDDQKKNEGCADEDMLEKDGIERCLVVQKLMDMEMIEPNNLENVQDIKEVLHLYSRLTCPVYVDIFDKFVMDMHSDIFNFKAT